MHKKTLSVVVPVYNEAECIEAVVQKWDTMLSGLSIEYDLYLYNDGSKDESLSRIKEIEQRLSSVKVVDKPNSGHGPTILVGYRKSSNYEWIFQVDSDDELGPEFFSELWKNRKDYDILLGIRDGRLSPLPRKIISLVSRWVVRLFYGTGIFDVNCPYRLMRGECFDKLFMALPDDTFAPNVIISGYACQKNLRIFQAKVTHVERQTGEVSIKKLRLMKAAIRAFYQSIVFRFRLP